MQVLGFTIPTLTENTPLQAYYETLPFVDTKSVIIGNLIYFLVILLLMRFMENRERFNPKPFMVFYNFVCVCLATYCFYGMVRYYFLQQPFLYCSNLDFASENAKTIAHFIYVFYIQKYWEFIDTFLFILRKSYRQVTFLHVYHHSSITVMTNLFLHVYPGGDNCLPVLLNSFVHMLMYTHYLCSVLGVKCWWRSILTKLQLIQFVLITVINVADLVKGGCQEPEFMNWILIGYMATMIVLFSQFYVRRYLSSPAEAKPKSQ
ncbi:hypothetical protein WA538_002579 [Blastocystis sp. DL]